MINDKIDNLIKVLIKKKVINSAQWRAIESFIATTLTSFFVLLLENIDLILTWNIIEFKYTLIVFVSWVWNMVYLWFRKWRRDKIKELIK
jgi:hypothetical protein